MRTDLFSSDTAAAWPVYEHGHASSTEGAAGVHTMTAARPWRSPHVLLHAALLLVAAGVLAPAAAQQAAGADSAAADGAWSAWACAALPRHAQQPSAG